MDGIEDRFGGNTELYELCFQDLLEEPNVSLLEEAIAAKDYSQAFASAHAIKGVAANLGLTPFHDAICVLVEALRVKDYSNIDAQFAETKRQFIRLERLYAGGEVQAGQPDAEDKPKKASEVAVGGNAAMAVEAAGRIAANRIEKKAAKKHDGVVVVAVTITVALMVLVSLLSFRLVSKYMGNTLEDSSNHLEEISFQTKLYIEECIDNDWRTTHSVASDIARGNYVNDDAGIFAMMQEMRSIWNATDIAIYTENGYSIRSNGEVEQNDTASNSVDKARKLGEYMTVVDSDLVFTVPITTDLQFNGSKIAAVSVIQSMDSFLDNMGFSSFDGKGYMYLTEDNGIVLSTLTTDATKPTFNFMALTDGKEIQSLDDESLTRDDLLTVTEPTSFLMADDASSLYVVVTPVYTHSAPLRLFYLAPESVVNETMGSFARQLAFQSIATIGIFAILSFATLFLVIRLRRRQFNEELRARDQMFDLLVANTQTAFALFNAKDDEGLYVSSNAEQVTGHGGWRLTRTATGLEFHAASEIDSPAIREVNRLLQAWDGTGEFDSGPLLKDDSKPPRYFAIQIIATKADTDEYVGIARDVTIDHEREEMTKAALEMAEKANEAKSHFLSNMSHDIRTPMNAIVNMTDFAIENEHDPVKLDSHLKTIRKSSHHLLALINDVLDVSRIESGQTVIAKEPFDIKGEMQRLADIVTPLCDAKDQTFATDFDGILARAAYGDQLKVSQIIVNLLSNAVKFTPAGGTVTFTATEIASLRNDIVDVRFTVEDNGMGISEEYLQHIFEPFSRADNLRVRQTEGTGLGLSICHGYVTAMGGTITCESKEGEGTVFIVELFFEKADAVIDNWSADALPGDTPFTGMRCLVGEDNDINQTIAQMMLGRLGFIVEIASDGLECLHMFEASQPGYYDIIYMDIQMPIMDGNASTLAIRKSKHAQAQTIPIVAMTANAFAEDIEKARISGMDGYLGKPIVMKEIIEETKKAIGKRKG